MAPDVAPLLILHLVRQAARSVPLASAPKELLRTKGPSGARLVREVAEAAHLGEAAEALLQEAETGACCPLSAFSFLFATADALQPAIALSRRAPEGGPRQSPGRPAC